MQELNSGKKGVWDETQGRGDPEEGWDRGKIEKEGIGGQREIRDGRDEKELGW